MELWDSHHLNHLDLGVGGKSTLLPAGGRCLHPDALAGQALQQTTTDHRIENSQPQDTQGEKGGRELIWYTCQEIQGAVSHHGAEAKSSQRHCVNMCGTT